MRWTLKAKPEDSKVNHLKNVLNIDHTIATLLVQRGVEDFETAKDFFRPSLDHLHDPFLMKDMQKAVDRIQKALANNERILVYGDYDVDGTTSVALMSSYLKTHSENISSYIPDRYLEGYGVSYKGIDFAHDNEFTLIITLDCGIKAIEKIAYAKEKGIDFIICDHHRPGVNIPDAVAVLDPKQDDCHYPYDELCGCGVGFKLIQAIASTKNETIDDLIPYLDLVATAIGADIVPITGENRTLAYFGMQVINTSPRAGFKAIINQIKKETLTITDVVFIIAPRINAAGRMKHGMYAVDLLTQTNFELAEQYATEIETFNSDRRDADKQITIEALQQIEEQNEQERFTSVVYNENWHKGVIGIVASRLIETYYRPTLVFTKSGDYLAASARSVSGFDVYNALEACAEHIEQFGGHKYAAGLILKPENYEAFKSAFEAEVKATIDPNLLHPEVKIDAQIQLCDVNDKLMRVLKQFAPFGPGNMSPIFMSENLQDTGYGKCVGEDDKHLRITVKDDSYNGQITCIGFNLGDKLAIIQNKKTFKAVYSIDENEWQGNVSLQLKLRDIKDTHS